MTWRRLESNTIDPEMTAGVASPIADPLWALARQWQVGEFRGEDAARPAFIEATVAVLPLTGMWTQPPGGRRITVERGEHGVPLETLVEMEGVRDGPGAVRLTLDSGAALIAAILDAVTGTNAAPVLRALRAQFAVTVPDPDGDHRAALDPTGHALLVALARRGVDGHRVRAWILKKTSSRGGDDAALAIVLDDMFGDLDAAPDVVPKLVAAARRWLVEEEGLVREPEGQSPTWRGAQLGYDMTVTADTADGVIELQGRDYPGGRLDWFQLDVRKVKGKGEDAGAASEQIKVLPVPLRFQGMPASRWWEIENHPVALAELDGGPEDFARSVVANFAAIGGDDWFVVPITVPSGSLVRVVEMHVVDDFGQRHPIRSTAVEDGPVRPWRWFELAGDTGPSEGRAPMLLVAPVVDGGQQGPVLERVDVRRDEQANLAWAIEHTVESHAGRPINRRAATQRARAAVRALAGENPAGPPPTEADPDAPWGFDLTTSVPGHWLPLVPVRITGDDEQVVLRRGRVAITDGDESAGEALGLILTPGEPYLLHEEEVPPGGARVERRFQYARGADGTPHLWMARRTGAAAGDVEASPLAFDRLRRG